MSTLDAHRLFQIYAALPLTDKEQLFDLFPELHQALELATGGYRHVSA